MSDSPDETGQEPLAPADINAPIDVEGGQGEQADGDRPLDPQKLLRVASLAREVLEELRRMPPESEGTDHLVSVYKQVRKQLAGAMPNKLVEELEAIELDLSFKDGATNDEVRVAYSALIGWLGGLFQGLQAATLHAQAVGELERHLGGGKDAPAGAPDKEGYL